MTNPQSPTSEPVLGGSSLREALEAIAKWVLVGPLMSEQGRQLVQICEIAKEALDKHRAAASHPVGGMSEGEHDFTRAKLLLAEKWEARHGKRAWFLREDYTGAQAEPMIEVSICCEAIASALRGQRQAEGWQLVPKEPTMAMKVAYCDKQDEYGIERFANINLVWPALLAAAPISPTDKDRE